MAAQRIDYARSADDISIAYRTMGDGPLDLVFVPGFVSHLEVVPEFPPAARFLDRLASFSRLIVYDKRGQGLSDRPGKPPTLEQSMSDLKAVLDAVGVERVAAFGISEGGPTCALFAATYPERVSKLALYGTWARLVEGPDFAEGLPRAMLEQFFASAEADWGGPAVASLFAADHVDDAEFLAWWSRLLRLGTSPLGTHELLRLYFELDVRHALPSIQAPTFVIHREQDRCVPIRLARPFAELIPGARMVELPGRNHLPFPGSDDILDPVQEFLTGSLLPRETDRALTTVMFTDIVDSTKQAAERGDKKWRDLIERHDRLVGTQVERYGGRMIKTMGDGVLATFDGPARAIGAAQSATETIRQLGIDIRAGLHTGEVELRDGDIAGIAVNIGARVSAQARPGEVLVSRTVTDLVAGSDIEFEPRGAHELRGVPGAWELFAVRSA